MPPNRLAKERSPYLLQHAQDPVDWYPWGEEAFERARKEDRPVFLSIGYSTCHWCHVMAHESFEDQKVARLLNEGFVAVKVDREERPDIDTIYMTVCQMISGSCGWPLSIFLTPEKKPFLALTYVPRESRSGRMGMLELLPTVRRLWATRRLEVTGMAEGIAGALHRVPEGPRGKRAGPDTLELAFDMLSERFDGEHGGFGTAPKFPSPHNLLFLMRHWKRSGEPRALEMVERTLDAMRRGGIRDQLGGGFHRYSTDEHWLVPHFEKMLPDQALLALAYTEAFQATGRPEHASVARETLDYVLRDLLSPEGAFFSAEDADSEGEEGRFYLWTEEELEQVLGREDAPLASRAFGVLKNGNYLDEASNHRTGRNILYLKATPEEMAPGKDPGELSLRLGMARQKLFEARQRRVRPHRDDKVLTDWNGLTIAALARAGRVLGEKRYEEAARRAMKFVQDRMLRDGRLLHRYREGEASIQGNLDDHAFTAWALLELYEATYEAGYLERAVQLNRVMLEHFWDATEGGLFFTPDDGEPLLVRPKECYDGALPSGSSVAALDLLLLASLTGDVELEKRADALTCACPGELATFPIAHCFLLAALDFALGPTTEVVVVGERGAPDTEGLLAPLRTSFLPDTTVLFRPAGRKEPEIARLAPFVKDLEGPEGKAVAHVCTGRACQVPSTDAGEMMAALRAPRK